MVFCLVAVPVLGLPAADAHTQEELEDARARLAEINEDVEAQLDAIASLKSESNAIAAKVSAEEARLEEAEAALIATRRRVQAAERRYERLQRQLSERVTELYMSGPGSSVDILLGASSIADLADRAEYAASIAQSDADLANEVENLRVGLLQEQQREEAAVAEHAEAFSSLQDQMAELQARFEREQALYQSVVDARDEAEAIVEDLRAQYQEELAAQVPPPPSPTDSVQLSAPQTGGSGAVPGANPFEVCPVGDPHAVVDGFGADRYGGGYHLHAGNDIIAPQGTPIYATFDGVARDASNSLGGLSVIVQGSQGYTYNAHMVSISKLGSVSAGDVIGLVGATGDTATPHNHFEWHPNVIPSGWPESPYGYSVVGDAVNPYPLLAAVC
jgi:murein DD-endopeptidase MepM/ murein hydrolase activator NlpD